MPASLARQSALSLAAGLATTFGGFLSTILVARLLGVEGAGIVAFATWIVTIAVVVTDLGLAGALTRYIPELQAQGKQATADGLARYLFRRQILALGAMSAGFAACSIFTGWEGALSAPLSEGGYLRSGLFWAIVGAACLTQGLASFAYGYLKGTQSFRRLAVVAIISGALQIATTAVGASLFGAAGALMAAVTGHIVAACLIWPALARGHPIPPELKRRVNRFALGSWASYVVTAFAWSRMEIFFLERSWGSEATGLFSVSLTLANLATQAPLLLTGALLPYMARHSVDAAHKAQDAYRAGMRILAFLIFPTCLGTAAIAPRLLPLLFGEEFAPAVPTAIVLVSAAAFSATASVAVTYLFAFERTHVVVATGALGAVLSVLVGLLAVPLYGPMAAAVGRGSIQLLLVGVAILYIHRRLDCAAPYGALARLLSAAAVCGSAAYLTLWAIPGVWGVAAAIAVGAGAYFFCVRLFGGLSAGDVERLAGAASAILPSRIGSLASAALRLLRPVREAPVEE